MPTSKIMNLIKMQLDGNYKWIITSNYVSGVGEYQYTYSYPSQKLYVMIPNSDSILKAKELIDKVELGDILDSSYGEEQSGNYVTQTPIIEETPDTSLEETPEITDEEEISNDNPLEDLLPNDEETNTEEEITDIEEIPDIIGDINGIE